MQTKQQAVKKWLSRARNMKKRLDALQESKRKAFNMACSSVAPPRLDAAAHGNASPSYTPMVRYAYFSEEVDKQILRLEQVHAEILSKIAQLEDNTFAALLTEYYINGKSWNQVAHALGYSYRDIIQRKHPAALRAVAALLKVDTK